MYIQDLIGDKGDIIEAAMRHPGMVPKRKPTIETAMKAVAAEVEAEVHRKVGKDFEAKLDEMYGMYTIMNGDYADQDAEAQDDYASGLDDAFEALLEPYTENLSQDFLGKETIDSRLWEDDAIVKMAAKIAKEVYKQLSYGKTPAQVLSNAGIVQSDVEVFFDTHMQPRTKEQEKADMADQEQTVEQIAATIKAHIGADFGQMEVYGDVEMLYDEDEILADAAGARLGVGRPEIDALQTAVMFGTDADALFKMIEEASEKPAKPAAKPKADKPAIKPKAEKAAPSGDAIGQEVLGFLKAHSAMPDTERAASLGVSRGTYVNWLNGKTPFAANDEQRATVRAQIVADLNGLHEALAILDSEDAVVVE